MPPGKAQGEDRVYQFWCRDVIFELFDKESFIPYEDDGIDVTFRNIGGGSIVFDIALISRNKGIIVAECRRQDAPVKQEAIFAFAYKVELLRKQSKEPVSGIFFTRRMYQSGAVKQASWAGIETIIVEQNQKIYDFVLVFHKYDLVRERRIRNFNRHISGSVSIEGSIQVKLIRGDQGQSFQEEL